MRLKELRKMAKMTQSDLAERLHVSRSAVATWENEGIEPGNDKLIQLADIFDTTIEYLLNAPDAIHRSTVARIPVLGSVAAGVPIEAIEEIVDWEDIPESMARSGDYFGLRIKGESMEPRIMSGDTVIVRRQPDVASGDIAIVLVNGEDGTCKRVLKHPDGGLTLMPLNPAACDPRYFTPSEIRDLPVTIVGKVVDLRGKL